MKYEVDMWNNFCRVFELPATFPRDFCFGGGHATNWRMVDWFPPVADVGIAGVDKDTWREEVGEIEITETTLEELTETLVPWLQQKQYVRPGCRYLVLTDFGATLLFEGHQA
jgi:hypothetical protein